ncbi:uncharacterized protein LOC135383139 [Ornithodoros turicata]|uniref:uncharacterized protein LOC135383139 n=1 Tax=Ornithodoros turicata TaxID=34597 RepID=UPI003139C84F
MDAFSFDFCVQSTEDSWLTSLTNKFKNERRKMLDNERVLANKAKYGRPGKRKRPEDGTNSAEEELKRRKLHKETSVLMVEGEDAKSIADHEEWLVKEDKKAAPDEDQIDVEFPLWTFPDLLAIHALQILGSCVKDFEVIKNMFMQYDTPIPATPCIMFTGSSIEQAEHMHLYVDKQRLFRTIDLEEGLAAIVAAYWLFQIVYSSKTYNTLCTLEQLCIKVSDSRPRSPVIKFFNNYGNEFAKTSKT